MAVWNHYHWVDIAFDVNKLAHAISHDKALNSFIEENDGQVNEHVSFFQNKHQPKGVSTQIYCFYYSKESGSGQMELMTADNSTAI